MGREEIGATDPCGPRQARLAAWLAGRHADHDAGKDNGRPVIEGPVIEGPVIADPVTKALFAEAAAAAASNATILVTGPSGAGKEVMARFLHDRSARRSGPFLAINCAALPETMLEALLFGHERGAFTGAHGQQPGLFRAASGGTLFLDEIGELPLALQAKLLRAVEQREILPLGATAPVRVDVRLLAATNRDLEAEAAVGRFREDLRWRLAVFPLALPPLARRPLDIVPLAAALVARLGGDPRAIGEDALIRLEAHGWPGNVRELSNVLERALILAAGGPLEARHIRIEGTARAPMPAAPACALPKAIPPQGELAHAVRAREAEAIRLALANSGGRRIEAARRLGISERTLRYKLAALDGRPRRAACAAPAREMVREMARETLQ
ncbi:sigma 54-interacting transcriptional regulator [Sandaracinobacteroides sp. A072]|uniref:sigma 54-interacting transcriptional regulator n=1 Tax=Sandaracinobacteroides sp. A072 TaxID=3461146 RepID=UPI0040433FF8